MFSENLTEFCGLRVYDYKKPGELQNPASMAPRVRCDYDENETLVDYLTMLLEEPGIGAVHGIVLGLWMENGEAFDVTPASTIELLVANSARLPALKALFVGDIISEENEVSWIINSDMSALWGAFPQLEGFGVRGGGGLRLGKINHTNLRKLVVQTGGLPGAATAEALDANAPLEHFELWIGDEGYGATTMLSQFDDLFAGHLFPGLKTLALRNCEFADEIAARLANSAILKRIEHLDLSMGTFRDPGAEALIASNNIAHLKSLNVEHHFMSNDVRARLARATPNLIAGEPEEADAYDGEVYYFVAVSE